METYSQAAQDIFVRKCLKEKRNGTFLEIGSNHPININNTYVLETKYGWRGILVEYDPSFLEGYKTHRPSSFPIIQDAQTIDWKKAMRDANMPQDIDYLQIDLEERFGSTLTTLKNLEEQIMATHRFACITFEHDIYCSNLFNTREESRKIFARNGYVRVFSDIQHSGCPYEDWYVHPDLVDMSYISGIKTEESMDYKKAIERMD